MNSKIKLGMIGLSDGNGHPYSWSAIFNGYDSEKIKGCGYPTIPLYLNKQKFPDDQITEAQVTHIWTQDLNISKHIASATHIEHIVEDYPDLIKNVDAVLLARDDSENHIKLAKPILEANIPIYIDKPMALTISEAEKLFKLERYNGQIFSCSAMRYAPELQLTKEQKSFIGEINSIHGYAPKDWDKYSVHIIEPLLQLIPYRGKILNYKKLKFNDQMLLMLNFKSGVDVQFQTCGDLMTPISLRVIGTKGWLDLYFKDTFGAFRSALRDFIEGIINKDVRTPSHDIKEVIKIIELGRG